MLGREDTDRQDIRKEREEERIFHEMKVKFLKVNVFFEKAKKEYLNM